MPPVSTERPATTILRIKMQGSNEHCIEPRRGRLTVWRVLCTCFDEPIQTSRYGHLQGMRNPASALRTHGPTFPFSSWTDLIQQQSPRPHALLTYASRQVLYIHRGEVWSTAYKVIPMSSANPLRLLRDLEKSSPEFPNQLTSILLREDCMNQAQALPCEDLGKFVEYLDSVCVQIVFTCSPLNGIVGPRRPRPQWPRLFSLFV